MSPTDPPTAAAKSALETGFERALFATRWLLAPFYVGLAVALAVLLGSFVREALHEIPAVLSATAKPEDGILLALSLVDMSLAANLLLIVMFSGYESFISKIDAADEGVRLSWMGKVDFSGLKMKLIGSIVAISAISLLKTYLGLAEGEPMDEKRLTWQVILHLSFVISGVFFALMDWLTSLGARGEGGH